MKRFDQSWFLIGVFCIVFLALALLFTPSARADLPVSVSVELTDIIIISSTDTIFLPFKDGVADFIQFKEKNCFIGFYTEAALQRLAGSGAKIYATPVRGITPYMGNVYLVNRNIWLNFEKDVYYAWPIEFVPDPGLRPFDQKRFQGKVLWLSVGARKEMERHKKLFEFWIPDPGLRHFDQKRVQTQIWRLSEGLPGREENQKFF
jgi:hypothetical protein